MKVLTMSSLPDEFIGISPAQSELFRQAKVPLCSPVGKTGSPANRLLGKARQIWASPGASFSAKAVMVILIVAALAFVAMVPPALCEMDEDLKDAVESHNAGRTREAIEIYTEILEENPRSAEALNWRGMAYDDLGKLDQALADLNKAIQLSPNYADAYNNRGEVHRKKKMYPQAKADYRKAMTLDKKFAEPHFNMALVLEQEKNNRGAAQELSQYLALKPNAEDRNEIEGKIKALGAPARAVKPSGPSEARKPAARAAAKPADRPGVGSWKVPSKKPPAAAGVPGMEQFQIPPEAIAILGTLGIFAAVLPLLFWIFASVMLFLIARKTATSPAWLAFIPIVQIVLAIMIAGKPLWWLILLLLPTIAQVLGALLATVDPTGGILPLALSGIAALVFIVAYLFICLGMAQARGKSVVWGILLFLPCTNLIALGYLGLSK